MALRVMHGQPEACSQPTFPAAREDSLGGRFQVILPRPSPEGLCGVEMSKKNEADER